MVSDDRENRQDLARTSLGRGYAIAMQVMAASAMMVVFPLLGRWLDGKCGTAPLLMFSGLLFGIYATFSQLLRISKMDASRSRKTENDSGHEPGNQGKSGSK